MPNKSAKKYVGVTLTKEEFDALTQLAENDHRSKSAAIRVALIEYLAKIRARKAS